MRYVSGIHALNLNCSLETTGDWHQSALRWKDVTFRNTEDSVFGDYGIENNKEIPEHEGKFAVANHLRALLDLLEEGKFTVVEGMRNDYICTDKYDMEFFQKVVLLRNSLLWHKIDAIMTNEFMMKWKNFKENYNCGLRKDCMQKFISFCNKSSNNFILKGGTALMFCYNLDRFSENIDLDGMDSNIEEIVKDFSQKFNFSYRVIKDTEIVKKYMILYDPNAKRPRSLKIEVSFRRKIIDKSEIVNIKGINVYTIDALCNMKALAYISRNKIRDIYDICFICDKYFDKLSNATLNILKIALASKELEHFDYIIKERHEDLIDNYALAEKFLKLFENLSLFVTDEEKRSILQDNNNDSQHSSRRSR